MYSDYNYGSYGNYGSYDYDAAASGIIGGLLIFYIFIWVICLAVSIVQIIGMWKMFKKAGKQGWEAIIPFYNMWTLFEVSGYPGYYIFFGFIPCAGPIILLVFEILAAISLSKKFNKSGGFAALLILVPVVGYCILGFGNDDYDESLGEHKNGSTSEKVTVEPKKEETTKSTGDKFCGNCGTKVAKNAKHCSNCGSEL